MANNWLQRTDSLRPNKPDAQRSYAVKFLEDEDPAALEIAANIWLWTLPTQQNEWSPHLVSLQRGSYITESGPPGPPTTTVMHTITITVFLEGIDIGPNPTGF